MINWIQEWRPVVLLLVPGASSNLKKLPATGGTPDDLIRVAEDLGKFIISNPAAESFRDNAKEALGDSIESAKKETKEATEALPAEFVARDNHSDACIEANDILTKGLLIIRAIFGATSPEYKQFIAKNTSKEEDEIEADALIGE